MKHSPYVCLLIPELTLSILIQIDSIWFPHITNINHDFVDVYDVSPNIWPLQHAAFRPVQRHLAAFTSRHSSWSSPMTCATRGGFRGGKVGTLVTTVVGSPVKMVFFSRKGQSTISMAMFNSKLWVYQGVGGKTRDQTSRDQARKCGNFPGF